MKSIFTLCIFIFFTKTVCSGQPLFNTQHDIDSVRASLKTPISDSARVLSIHVLSRYLTLSNTKEAVNLSEEGLTLAQKINYPYGELKCRETLAFLYGLTGVWEKGFKNTIEGIALSKKYAPADEVYLSNMFALLYQRLGDNEASLEWGKKSYNHPLFSKSPVDIGQWATLMTLGQQYERLNILDSAYYYTERSITFSKNYAPQQIGHSLRVLSRIYFKQNRYEEAIKISNESREIFKKINFQYSVHEMEDLLANIYFKINKLDSAEHYAQLALAGGKQMNDWLSIRSSAKILADIYEKNSPSKAYSFLKIANNANDTITDLEKIKQINLLQIKEKQRIESLHLAEMENQNKLRFNTILGFLVSVCLIALILYRNNRQKQKTNEILEKAFSSLKSTQNQLIQKEKLASLGELTAGIAHEIQNPLNFVNNFSELSVDLVKDLKDEMGKPDIDKDYIEELFDDLSSNQEKINHHGNRASSIVKGMLEHSRASTGVKGLTDINKLADEYLRLSYHGLRAKDKDFNADFTTDFEGNLPKTEVISQDIGRVLLNLINNAFYAVNQRAQLSKSLKLLESSGETYTPSVFLSTKLIDNQIVISVKDNGNGMSEAVKAKVFQPFFTTKPTGEGTGLGLSLAYDIVTKGHEGTLEVVSTEGVGSEFIIKLPSAL